MRRVIGHWLLVIGGLLVAANSALADGGAVLTSQVIDDQRITVFAEPSPLRAGPADISVMVQDAKTGQPRLDRTITVQVRAAAAEQPTSEAWVPPCCSMKTDAKPVAATREAAQNKLLYAANVVLPASGAHEILVQVSGGGAEPAQLAVATRVEPPAPPAAAYWAFLVAPPLVIAGFALNQRLRRRG